MENDLIKIVNENKKLSAERSKMMDEIVELREKVFYLEKDNWFLKDKLCVENGSRGKCEKCGTISVISLTKTYAV